MWEPLRPEAVAGLLTDLDVPWRIAGGWALERFGEGELEGWSAMQFIETSSLTIHADEFSGRCYVDVFSCKSFDPEMAAAIAIEHFGGWPKLTVLHR